MTAILEVEGLVKSFGGVHAIRGLSLSIEEGSVDEHSFVAVYRRAGVPIGVLAIGRDRPFTRWRRELSSAAAPAKTSTS